MRLMRRRRPRAGDLEARHRAALDLAVDEPLDGGEQRPFLGADERDCLALDAGAAGAADAVHVILGHVRHATSTVIGFFMNEAASLRISSGNVAEKSRFWRCA